MEILKHIGQLVFMALVALLFFALVSYVQVPLVGSRLTTGVGRTYDQWLTDFQWRAAIGIAAAWLAAWAWYLVSQLTSLNNWTRADRQRVLWFLLLLLPMGAFAVAWLTLPPAQEGHVLAVGLILLNNVGAFYLATVCFSPSAFKYTPPGAALIRRW